jgi:hypothetical protein
MTDTTLDAATHGQSGQPFLPNSKASPGGNDSQQRIFLPQLQKLPFDFAPYVRVTVAADTGPYGAPVDSYRGFKSGYCVVVNGRFG